ncbi:MAG: signal peptide peptidase SppA [Acidaminococcaceae bacterium]|nr:signal peptide peptidase SppA [Acidaminococcaceae bacterium]
MLKRIFISAILLIAVLSFVISLLGGNNNAEPVVPVGNRVAVIRIEGPIMAGDPAEGLFDEDVASTGKIMSEIRAAAKDKSVKAILLRINSPGGSVTAAEEIAREIMRLKQETGKPVVASMGDTAASAGYWLAACSDRIYANSSTLTGSIGVYIPYLNTEELYKKIGVYGTKIKSGEYKDILSNERPMTKSERDILQKMVNEMYVQFVNVVSEGRKMPAEKVRTLADGRVYTGRQAKELGLVDEIGNYYDALDATGKLIGVEGTPEVKEYKRQKPWQSLWGAKFAEIIVERITGSINGGNRSLQLRTPHAEG